MNDPNQSDPTDERTGFALIGEEECTDLLGSVPLGRLGFAQHGVQVILPVNFLWFEGSVVFRTLDGAKMDAAIFVQSVAFEVDSWDSHDRTGWSVLVKGTAHRVDEWAEVEALERQGLVPWSRQMWRPYWIRIDPSEITGRRLV